MALSVNIGEYWRDKKTKSVVVEVTNTSIWLDSLAVHITYADEDKSETIEHIMTETQFLRLYERINNEKN